MVFRKSASSLAALALLQALTGGALAGEDKAPQEAPVRQEKTVFEPARDRGYLGYSTRYEGRADGSGQIRVVSVLPGGPADRAGLKRDDLIVRIEGEPFTFENDLDMVRSFSWLKAGARFRVEVLRDGETRSVELEATRMSDEQFQGLSRWVATAIAWYEEGGQEACRARQKTARAHGHLAAEPHDASCESLAIE